MKKNYIVSILAKICLFFNYGLQNKGDELSDNHFARWRESTAHSRRESGSPMQSFRALVWVHYGLETSSLRMYPIIMRIGVSQLVCIIELAFILFFQGFDEIIDHFVIGRCNS